jgi:hypothetical protein
MTTVSLSTATSSAPTCSSEPRAGLAGSGGGPGRAAARTYGWPGAGLQRVKLRQWTGQSRWGAGAPSSCSWAILDLKLSLTSRLGILGEWGEGLPEGE